MREQLVRALSAVDVPWDRDASYRQCCEAVERLVDAALAVCAPPSDTHVNPAESGSSMHPQEDTA